MENDIDRINRLLNFLKLSKNKLGKSIGDKNGMRFQNVLSGRNRISEKLAKDITDVYPEINYTWLLKGYGDMILKIEQQEDRQTHDEPTITYMDTYSSDKRPMGVPVLDVELSCGKLRSILEAREIHYPIAYLNIPDVKGCDVVLRARGDSMEDRIHSGDWVGVKKLEYWKTEGFFGGLIYAIVTKEQEIMKYLFKVRNDPDMVRIASHNKHYEDELIKKDDILELWEVKVVLPISGTQIF